MAVAGPRMEALAERSGRNGPPIAEQLLAVFQDNYWPGRDTGGEAYAVAYSVPGVAISLKGKGGLRQKLAADMWALTGKMPTQDALTQVMGVVEGLSWRMKPVTPALRSARLRDGSIAIDLGDEDGTAVVVNGSGWRLDASGVALFRRTALTPALPVPERGGSGRAVMSLVNIEGKDETALYMACRLASLIPGITRPVEIITGQPGTVKTGTTRITVEWTGGAVVPMPRDPRDWAAMASGAGVLGHDNVSSVSVERSDLLCKAASGDTWAARALYTDSDLVVSRFSPVSVVLNTVDAGAFRADLIRRAVCHYLTKPARYLGDGEVAEAWERERAGALGWLLDLLAAVMREMASGRLAQRPGEAMADFARVLDAVDSLWGTHGTDAWKAGQAASHADALDDDAVAIALGSVVRGPWEGTSADLLALLRAWLPESAGAGGRRDWTPRLLSGRLDRARAYLEAAGWRIVRTEDRHLKSRRIALAPPGTW